MKALLANYFLKAFLQTVPMALEINGPGHKNFTFQLPGKCDFLTESEAQGPWTLL